MPLLIFVGIVTLGCRRHIETVERPETGYAFPTAEAITRIHVRNDGLVMDFEDFEAPTSDWSRLLAALSPSQSDSSPAGWEGLASLQIRLTEGEILNVEVYALIDKPVGAFAVDSPPPHGRRFYRGGNTKRFMEALVAAAENAKRTR